MKGFKLLMVIFSFYGCGISESQYDDLKLENLVLKERIDSVSKELNDLKFGAKNLLAEAKLKIDSKEFISSKNLLLNLIAQYPASAESNTAKTLLKAITPKAESQLFYDAEKSKDAGLFKNYIEQYPGGRYYTKARNLIRRYQNKTNVISAYSQPRIVRTIPHETKRIYKSSSGIRVGAICCDGTQSSATGRGACSHHGGVCQWLYQ